MKKRLLLFLTFITISTVVNAQNEIKFKNDSVKQFIDKTLLVIHDNALNKDKINWQRLRTEVYEKTKEADNIEAILYVYPYLFEKIGDHHGWLSYKNKNYRWNKNSLKPKDEIVKNAVKKYEAVEARLLNKNIGYLRIPGNSDFNGKKMDSIASNIVEEINTINSDKIKGWIIDLRLNTGGNMYPMMAGISDLIGNNEKIGGFITSDNQSDGDWLLKDGNIYVDTNQVLNRQKLKMPVKKQIPIAVLISGYTASSGEMTAIALIGRKNTKVFGEESAGYTTTNQGFEIDKNGGLNLAIGYVTDRNGKIYTNNIKPDFEIIGGDNFENLIEDGKIIKSIKWIRKTY
ncbi:S41 family peptidase [Flavobacterium sp.]|uniref:S41 family peptidase n=1 Tax=Flavobacterium sp. TaxID=239 RepID=UPI00326606BE